MESERVCSRCGTINRADAKYCEICAAPLLVIVLGTTVLLGQAPEKAATSGEPTRTEDFATAMKKLRERWCRSSTPATPTKSQTYTRRRRC